MPISIKDPETERLVRDLAKRTGESITIATKRAIEERLHRVSGTRRKTQLLEDLAAIRERCAQLPVLDNREAESILGYERDGLPS
jgi:antitoxin VapB